MIYWIFKTIKYYLKLGVRFFEYNNNERLVIFQVFLFRERLQKLKKYTASQYEYLKLRDKDGIVIHKRG